MSSTPSNPLPPPACDRLAQLSLAHVVREQAQLDATRVALGDVRAALTRHQATVRAAEAVCRDRAAFRQEAADLLGVPPASVTLDLLVARLPADAAGPVAEARTRLRQQAAEVQRLNDSNASLVYYCLDFLQRFFDRLTGRPRDGRYGPAGTLAAACGGSLINARG